MTMKKIVAGCDDILFSSQDKSWPKYYGERGPAWSLVFCPPHPISPTQHTAPWDFRGTNNFIVGVILNNVPVIVVMGIVYIFNFA